MKKFVMIIMAVALVALPTMAQYGTRSANDQLKTQSFQSTSTMTPSGSAYSANPTLNADGTAHNPAAAPSNGPRRAKMDDGDDEITIVTPGQGGSQAPIGDAMLPMALFAMAFAMVIAIKGRMAKG